MKKLFYPICFSIFCFGLPNCMAQVPATKSPTTITVLASDGVSTTLQFTFGNKLQKTVPTPAGDAVSIGIDKGTPLLQKGFPDLPKVTASIIIPDDWDMQATVTASHYTDYADVNVVPSKGSLLRTIDPETVAYTYNEVYNEDIFYPKAPATLRTPYILRDYRGQTVVVYPFQYNAVTKTLRVYHDITVKVSPDNSAPATNAFIRKHPVEEVQDEFNDIYKHQFINYNPDNGTRYTPLSDRGNMLIICGSDFLEAIQPLADWKNEEGIKTEVVDVATIGNDATSIKNYVTDYYNTHGLTFLLLVGDNAQVVTGTSDGGDSDNQYGYLAGNDHYQELFVGRISAATVADVTTQVDRTLEYEKNPIVDSSYAKGVAIGSQYGAGYGDDGEADWQHERNIRYQLLGYTYTGIQELFDGTYPGGNDADGYPSNTDLATQVNNGIGIINYTGHGYIDQIATTNFHNSDVDGLTNNHHYPFLWIVGCETGNFKSNTCFAEEWARHTYNGTPAGSIAGFMSTVDQYWTEPMQAQDEFNNILVEAEANNIKRTFAGLSINGCFSMNDEYSFSGYDMTDTWTVFGDPSVMVRTTQPSALSVTHDSLIFLGTTSFDVTCQEEGAVAALSRNGILLGSADVSGGIATIQLNQPLSGVDSVLITVTAFNRIPYQKMIPTYMAAGDFLVNTSMDITDALGNNNGFADYGENIGLNAGWQNVGADPANDVTATLTSVDSFVTITDGSESYGNIASDSAVTHNDAFSFAVAGDATDGHAATFTATASDDAGHSWSSDFTVTLNAPVLNVTSFTIDDSMGNGDGYPDPGETVIVKVYNANNGHADAAGATGTLTTTSPYATIAIPDYSLGALAVGSTPYAEYDVTISPNTPYGAAVDFHYELSAGSYLAPFDFSTVVTPAIEDFETNDFSQFNWQFDGNKDWTTESYDVYEGAYSACSGDIGNNQSSVLMITLNAYFDDNISFAMRVSSEPNYDSLSFHIDNVSMGHWSGEVAWNTKSYPVTQGLHTYKWIYQKDAGASLGSDCGFLDNIVFPAYNNATAVFENTNSEWLSIHPNPFDALTFIDYKLDRESAVTIQVFDLHGKLLRTLISNDHEVAGIYHYGFDGSSLPQGNYLCVIRAGEKTFTQKLLISR